MSDNRCDRMVLLDTKRALRCSLKRGHRGKCKRIQTGDGWVADAQKRLAAHDTATCGHPDCGGETETARLRRLLGEVSAKVPSSAMDDRLLWEIREALRGVAMTAPPPASPPPRMPQPTDQEWLIEIERDAQSMAAHYPNDRRRLTGLELLRLIVTARAEGRAEQRKRDAAKARAYCMCGLDGCHESIAAAIEKETTNE